MDVLDREALITLSRPNGWPSLSVYLPTHPLPRQSAEDRVRLKNLVRSACEQLVAEGMRAADAERFCQPVRTVLDDDAFWRSLGNGVAIFTSAEETRVFRVEQSMPEQFVVGDRYYLRPLLTAYGTDETFYALALDKNKTRLFRGDRSFIEELDLPAGTPTSFEEAMQYDDTLEPNMTTNTFNARGGASRSSMRGGSVFAGHGGAKDAAAEQTVRYARLIEHGVTELLKNETAPLLLFGIERQLSDYRMVNHYANLVREQVTGASDYLSPKQIHETSLEVLKPHLEAGVDSDLHELTENGDSELASQDPSQIVAAAAAGRVKTLFFDDSVGPFGTLDRQTFEVKQVCDDQPRYLREQGDATAVSDSACGWDLVDLAAAETALHGGEVHAFTGEDAPIHGVAAVYRY